MAKFEDAAREIHAMFVELENSPRTVRSRNLLKVIKKHIEGANMDDAYALLSFYRHRASDRKACAIRKIAEILEQIELRVETGNKWTVEYRI